MVFHVYVDGVTGTAPDAARELSETMSARYGLPAAELRARLARGRFRVKANVDQTTAHAYARALEAIGARVHIEPAEAPPASRQARPSQPPLPAARASTPSQPPQPASRPKRASWPQQPALRPTTTSLPPQPASSTSTGSLPPQPTSRPTKSSLPPQPGARPTKSSLAPQRESRAPTPLLAPQPAARSATPSLPPQPAARSATPSLPPQPASRSSSTSWALPPARQLDPESALELALQLPSPLPSPASPSGLEAASGAEPATRLGALERSGLLSLASLDDDASSVAAATFSAAAAALPASIGPTVSSPTARSARPRPKDEPVDLFAPPDADAGDVIVELAADEIAHRARKRMTAPPEAAPAPARRSAPSSSVAPEPAARRSTPVMEAGPAGAASPADAAIPTAVAIPTAAAIPTGAAIPTAAATPTTRTAAGGPTPLLTPRLVPKTTLSPTLRAQALPEPPATTSWLANPRKLLASPRARLGVGVLLAIVLGFLPADLVASLRERSALRAIDARVVAVQADADSQDRYDALDAFRAEQLELKRSKRRMIMLTSMLMWAATSGALGYVWFKRIRWERFD